MLGWVFAGGALERLEEVKKLSFNLGMAFQIIDDIEDLSQASERVIINYAATLGTLKAKAKALEHLQQAQALFKALKLETPILELFVQMLMAKAT